MKYPKFSSSRLPILVLAFIWIPGLYGCSITSLQHDGLEEPTELQSGVVNVAPLATGFSGGRVGWGRITVFAIPVVPIHIQSDEASDVMDVVRDALITAGYQIDLVDNSLQRPVLSAHVNKARFSNYTWIVPIVPTWGRINVTLRLESANGILLWENSFEGAGYTLNFTDGYNIAATKSVTRMANSMVEAFSDPEFNAALAGEG